MTALNTATCEEHLPLRHLREGGPDEAIQKPASAWFWIATPLTAPRKKPLLAITVLNARIRASLFASAQQLS
jgi:hypothetical protein